MMDLEPTLPALLNLLRQEESSIKKGQTPALVIGKSSSTSSKPVAKKKGMKKSTKLKKKVLRSNCPEFLASLIKKKQVVASSLGALVTQNCFSINPTSLVLDTGSGSHICNLLQGLRSYHRIVLP